MSMVTKLIKNLKGAASFIDSQRAALGDEHATELQAIQVNSLAKQLEACKQIDFDAGTQLTDAVKEGPWTADERKRLLAIIAKQTVTSLTKQGHKRENQECLTFELYLDEKD